MLWILESDDAYLEMDQSKSYHTTDTGRTLRAVKLEYRDAIEVSLETTSNNELATELTRDISRANVSMLLQEWASKRLKTRRKKKKTSFIPQLINVH